MIKNDKNSVHKNLSDNLKSPDYTHIEKMLSGSQLLFKQLWDISVDGMRLTDEQGNMIAVNKAFCKTVEKTKEELVYQSFPVIYHRREQKKALEMYKHDLQHNAIKTHFEHERVLWNNKKVWFDFTNSFIELPGFGKIVLSIINDITAKKIAEIDLQKSKERYELLFNSANDAVFICHLNPDNHFEKFIEINNLACSLLEFSKSELSALDFYQIIPPKSVYTIQSAIEKLINENHTIYELELLKKDRRPIPVEISAHLFKFENKPTVLSIARNLTNRRKSEKQIHKSSKLLRDLSSRLQDIREEERTMIAREIHDELGQNLTVLKMQISLLSNKLLENQDHLKDKLLSAANLIDQTVESVQRISSKLRPGILDELGLIPAIEWQSQEFEERTGIKCNYTLPSEELKLDRDKATALFRIFQEALTNVVRHADAQRVSILLRKINNSLLLEITDNGRGIKESQMKNTGSLGILGMQERAIVFGGEVMINGVPDKGTNVKVRMPLENISNLIK
jgi:PAS domain S-box-containing protein